MSPESREQMHRRVGRLNGVREVRRPETGHAPAFCLSYVRNGPVAEPPVVVIPGGPGLGSILPYAGQRRRAAAKGMDVLMVEHRGVGLSRADEIGEDLPATAMRIVDTVDDIAAVLDAEAIPRAVVYGSSYGSYLAQVFGARHPERVDGMVLDSAMASAHDHQAVRAHARSLLWEGTRPETAECARLLRTLVDTGAADVTEASDVARIVYEFAGPELLTGLLRAYTRGRASWTWRRIAQLNGNDTDRVVPFVMEFDLVGHIAFRELNYAPEPDGGIFDPGRAFADLAGHFPAFEGEPVDLQHHRPKFDWPVAVLSGERDLRTPPTLARQIVDAVPDGVLIRLPDNGHSALDTHALAGLATAQAVRNRAHRKLGTDSSSIAALPRVGSSRHIGTLVRASLAVERLRPAGRPPSGR